MNKLFRNLSYLIISIIISACSVDDDFSTSIADHFTFSSDTLKTGTVISMQGSSTRGFVIYNRSSKGLRIQHVALEKGIKASGFRVNVSGTSIGDAYQGEIDVRKGDSLQVFVEITPNKQHSNLPILIEDKLTFTLESGLRQEVILQAYGQDVVTLRKMVVNSDTTLRSACPYVVFDSIYVAKGATLTIEKGVTLMFHNNASLVVDGSLNALGTMQHPITFRGDRLDDMFENQPYDRIAGQWKGIYLNGTSTHNYFNYCDIHSSYVGIDCQPSDLNIEKLKIENSIVHNTKGDGLSLKECNVFVGNTQLTNALHRCVAQYGGISTFVHCTIGQFYPFSGNRMSALFYTNEYNGNVAPLHAATFLNCVITGYSSDEISAYKTILSDPVLFEYHFENSLLNTPETIDAERIINVVWDNKENPVCCENNFLDFKISHLLFDFRLHAKSKAIGLGNSTITQQYYPTDRLGIDRLSNNASDAGCYEYVESSTSSVVQ
ncbi:MAG: hypothetical protein RR386_00685 [Bacteroidaceae bacterium]